MSDIHPSAIVNNSKCNGAKLFKNVNLNDSVLGAGVSVGDDTTIQRSNIAENVAINRRNYINDSFIGEFSYTGLNCFIHYTKMGKYCSIGPNVDIGAANHNYTCVTTMPKFRFNQMLNGTAVKGVNPNNSYCHIGNDVWIGTGAVIMKKVKISDGAIVGAGAVVTHDVPPYAIVAGVPAKIIKYRFEQKYISRLLTIEWWNWPNEIIQKYIDLLCVDSLTDEILYRIEEISHRIKNMTSIT